MTSEFFGADSTYHGYVRKTRWIILCMLTVILLLLGTMAIGRVGIFESFRDKSGEAQATLAEPVKKSILIARQRIESGTSLTAEMFDVKDVPVDLVTASTISADDVRYVIGKYSKEMIKANEFLVRENIQDQKPLNPFEIPPGYRAVSLYIDPRSAVEGFARPNTRVDVLWLYSDGDGNKKVATLVHFARVLSLNGTTEAANVAPMKGGLVTATLLVAEKEAKLIELARDVGTLSLSLVGEQEPNFERKEDDLPASGAVSISDVIGKPKAPDANPFEGTLTTRDPVTGQKLRFILDKERWEPDPEYKGDKDQAKPGTPWAYQRAQLANPK